MSLLLLALGLVATAILLWGIVLWLDHRDVQRQLRALSEMPASQPHRPIWRAPHDRDAA